MGHFVKEMFDQLADLLDEFLPQQPNVVTWEMKRHYLNMGQYAMWPRIYRTMEEEVPVVDAQNEYPLSADVTTGRIVYVSSKTNEADACYTLVPDDWYDILPGPTDIFRFRGMPTDSYVGGMVRVMATVPLVPIVAADETEAASEVYSGPDYSVEGPALYAMNRITARGLHSRLDFAQQSVDYNNRSAVPNELMASSIFWLDEFERRVDFWQLVHPRSVS